MKRCVASNLIGMSKQRETVSWILGLLWTTACGAETESPSVSSTSAGAVLSMAASPTLRAAVSCHTSSGQFEQVSSELSADLSMTCDDKSGPVDVAVQGKWACKTDATGEHASCVLDGPSGSAWTTFRCTGDNGGSSATLEPGVVFHLELAGPAWYHLRLSSLLLAPPYDKASHAAVEMTGESLSVPLADNDTMTIPLHVTTAKTSVEVRVKPDGLFFYGCYGSTHTDPHEVENHWRLSLDIDHEPCCPSTAPPSPFTPQPPKPDSVAPIGCGATNFEFTSEQPRLYRIRLIHANPGLLLGSSICLEAAGVLPGSQCHDVLNGQVPSPWYVVADRRFRLSMYGTDIRGSGPMLPDCSWAAGPKWLFQFTDSSKTSQFIWQAERLPDAVIGLGEVLPP